MGDQQHGDALGGPYPLQLVLQARAGESVERAERLVEQEDPRPVDQATGDGDPLRHAARELVRIGILETVQPHQRDVFGDRVPALGLAQSGIEQAERDVLRHGQPRKQPRLLEHQAAIEARRRDALAVERHAAVEVGVQSCDEAQQGGLAAAARSHDRQEAAGLDRQIQAVEHT